MMVNRCLGSVGGPRARSRGPATDLDHAVIEERFIARVVSLRRPLFFDLLRLSIASVPTHENSSAITCLTVPRARFNARRPTAQEHLVPRPVSCNTVGSRARHRHRRLSLTSSGSAFAPPCYVIAALAVGMLALTQLREVRVSTGEDIASLNLRQ
jgi:hypothetical protein